MQAPRSGAILGGDSSEQFPKSPGQDQSGSVHPVADALRRDLKNLGRFLFRELLDLTQQERGTVQWLEPLKRLANVDFDPRGVEGRLVALRWGSCPVSVHSAYLDRRA